MADIPHFSFPFRRGANNKVAVDEQDTTQHIMSCENTIVRCPLGFREDRPEFGWPFPMFENIPLNLSSLEAALRRFEPRGEAKADEYAAAADAAAREIKIEVEG
jgi:hypothetical protein